MPRHQIIAAIRTALASIASDYESALDSLTETARALEAEEQEQDAWASAQEAANAAWLMHGHQLCADLNSYPEAIEASQECPF